MKSKWINLLWPFVVAAGCLLSVLARAGNEVGNGGNAVVCENGSPKKITVELLDLVEAKLLRNWTVDSAILGTDAAIIAKSRLRLLSEVDLRSSEIFGKALDRVLADMSLEKEIALVPVDDSKHVFQPGKGCAIEQLAVLRKKALPGEKRILIREPIWSQMTATHRAGLLLHEAIYEHLAFLGNTDSTNARTLVSFFLSNRLDPKNPNAYWDLIRELRLPIYRNK